MKYANKSIIKWIVVTIIVIALGVGGFLGYKYFNSIEYKLHKKGYSKDQIVEILKLKQEYKNYIFNNEYNPEILKFYKEKYFIMDNLKKYLNYKKENKDISYSDIVVLINVRANEEFYTDPIQTDLSKDTLILVNKFNYLPSNYEIEDLVKMNLQYAFNDKKIRAEVYDNFKDLVNVARQEGLTILANSAYRDNIYQTSIYDSIKNRQGRAKADSLAARPGYSEHETGLALDVSTLKGGLDGFETTDEFTWIKDNAYKFGFILRYPEGKEHITGYSYEPWHYRYVGVDVAEKIYELDITFDEYYAFYLK
jgi:D-alanyl-D-alanine carboxypeptidase